MQGDTGPGLTISRRLAELMGGTLTASSQPGRETTFPLDLPFCLPALGVDDHPVMVFATVPIIRHTIRGLRDIPAEIVESAQMSGASPAQLRWQVKLPLAMPTLVAVANRSIMVALFMVIIAAFIGTQDLGQGSRPWLRRRLHRSDGRPSAPEMVARTRGIPFPGSRRLRPPPQGALAATERGPPGAPPIRVARLTIGDLHARRDGRKTQGRRKEDAGPPRTKQD